MLMRKTKCPAALAVVFILFLLSPFLHADSLDELARDFWAWRASEQPINGDDIPRIERPESWVPDWSAAAVARNHNQLEEFEIRWHKIDASAWPVARQVDYRLMGSALARVRWEIDYVRAWQHNPLFYLQQTFGAYYEQLIAPPPFDAARTRHIIAILNSFPRILEDAQKNLIQPAAPFAGLALSELQGVGLAESVRGLKPLLDPDAARDLDSVTEHAVAALESYRDWLTRRLPAMPAETAVGRDAYVFFLKNVALLPFTPEELLVAGRQDWARSIASQTYEEHRNLRLPQLALLKDQAEQMARQEKDELAVRRYLEEQDLLTVPAPGAALSLCSHATLSCGLGRRGRGRRLYLCHPVEGKRYALRQSARLRSRLFLLDHGRGSPLPHRSRRRARALSSVNALLGQPRSYPPSLLRFQRQ
jgi:hypothetical protein